jgi:hypothetical protein
MLHRKEIFAKPDATSSQNSVDRVPDLHNTAKTFKGGTRNRRIA